MGGICMDSNAEDFDTFGKDCLDICSGTAMIDRCGQCLYSSASEWDSCVGCDNVVNSNKVYSSASGRSISTPASPWSSMSFVMSNLGFLMSFTLRTSTSFNGK